MSSILKGIKLYETHSTGTTIGSAGIGGGSGLGIEKSPIEKALENGWRKTTIEADDIEFEGNVTREELEAKAKELNIGFNSKTSNETLTERINEALKEG